MSLINNISQSVSRKVEDSMVKNVATTVVDRAGKEALNKAAAKLAGGVGRHVLERSTQTAVKTVARSVGGVARAHEDTFVKAAVTASHAQSKVAAVVAKGGLTHAQIVLGARTPMIIRESIFHPVNAVEPASKEGQEMLAKLWNTKQVEKAFTEQSFTQPMQDTYRTLQRTLKGRPDGQLALQYLLQDKKLTIGGNDARKSLLGALKSIVDRKGVLEGPKNGINHALLLSHQAQELADVISISQEHKGVCAATSAGQILWAIKNPVDYTKFVVSMAADGKAKLPNGDWVKRVPDWRAGSDQIPSHQMLPGGLRDGRSIPGQLVQPSFMQVAVGKAQIYDNRRDLFVAVNNHAKVVADGGLYDEQTQNLVSSLYPGENWKVTYPSKADMPPLKNFPFFKGQREATSKGKMMDFLKANASPDAPIPVGVNYQLDGGHELIVTGTSPASKGGVDIQYINPWGRLEKMHEKSFELTLGSMVSGGSFGGVKV
jgi:hypothetical protein